VSEREKQMNLTSRRQVLEKLSSFRLSGSAEEGYQASDGTHSLEAQLSYMWNLRIRIV
jgi:hypothetical protein